MISSMDCSRAARQAGSVSVADQAWALLLQVAFERVQAHFAAAVAELDLAPMQAKALHELDVEPPISMRELAERLRSDPSNVTGLIDRLEARGLVERRPDPKDPAQLIMIARPSDRCSRYACHKQTSRWRGWLIYLAGDR